MRPIDADALKDAMYTETILKDTDMQRWASGCWIRYKLFENVLKEQPTIDAVPVIRCKDCIHRDPDDKKCDSGHGIQWQLPRPDDWYCADAERKENHDTID